MNKTRLQWIRLGREEASLRQERSELIKLSVDIESLSEVNLGSGRSLRLEDVKRLAQEVGGCDHTFTSKVRMQACFRKLDASGTSYAMINVYCNGAGYLWTTHIKEQCKCSITESTCLTYAISFTTRAVFTPC